MFCGLRTSCEMNGSLPYRKQWYQLHQLHCSHAISPKLRDASVLRRLSYERSSEQWLSSASSSSCSTKPSRVMACDRVRLFQCSVATERSEHVMALSGALCVHRCSVTIIIPSHPGELRQQTYTLRALNTAFAFSLAFAGDAGQALGWHSHPNKSLC